MSVRDVATRFASTLDAGAWSEFAALLAPDCVYTCRGSVMRDDAIVDAYRVTDAWVRATFHDVRYESSVTTETETVAVIDFRDQMSLGANHLDFRCQQRITIDAAGRVVQIEHIDLPGEREKADRFNRACGVRRP